MVHKFTGVLCTLKHHSYNTVTHVTLREKSWIQNSVIIVTILLHSTGNYIQYPVINHNGKEFKKKNVYMCITESLCCTSETNTKL